MRTIIKHFGPLLVLLAVANTAFSAELKISKLPTYLSRFFDQTQRVKPEDNFVLQIWSHLLKQDPESGLIVFFLAEKTYKNEIYSSEEFYKFLDQGYAHPAQFEENAEDFLRLLSLYPENDLGRELRIRMTIFMEVKKQMELHAYEISHLVQLQKRLENKEKNQKFKTEQEKNEFLSYLKDPEAFRTRILMQVHKHEQLANVFSVFPLVDDKSLIRNKAYSFYEKDKSEKNEVILNLLSQSFNDELVANLKFFEPNFFQFTSSFGSDVFMPVDEYYSFATKILGRYQSRTMAQELKLTDSEIDFIQDFFKFQYQSAKKNPAFLEHFHYKLSDFEEVLHTLRVSLERNEFKPEHFGEMKSVLFSRYSSPYSLSERQLGHFWKYLVEHSPHHFSDLRNSLNEMTDKKWNDDNLASTLISDSDDFEDGLKKEVFFSFWGLLRNKEANNVKSYYSAIIAQSDLLSAKN